MSVDHATIRGIIRGLRYEQDDQAADALVRLLEDFLTASLALVQIAHSPGGPSERIAKSAIDLICDHGQVAA